MLKFHYSINIYQWKIQKNRYIPNYKLIRAKSYKSPSFLLDQYCVGASVLRIVPDKQHLLSKVNNSHGVNVKALAQASEKHTETDKVEVPLGALREQ